MLRDEIESAKAHVKTDTLSLSIGEIASMYRDKELDVAPEFQRLFRWSIKKQSDFIESVLIGIPIPAIFAYEKEDGTWELIDGLQRVSTLLKFMGVLRRPQSDNEEDPTKLLETKYLPSLEGSVWSEEVADRQEGTALEKSLQLFFRRARIDIQVLKQPSDARTKYDLFQRLNRGGAYANEQEVRSCAMVMIDAERTAVIRRLAESEAFERVFRVNAKQKENQTNIEYLVRLICHLFKDYDAKFDVGEFLDRSILEILVSEGFDDLLSAAERTVNLLDAVAGDSALLPPANEAGVNAAPRFSLRALEAIAVGVGRNIDKIESKDSPDEYLETRIADFWRQDEVEGMSASGLRGTVRLQRTVPFGARWFAS